MKISKEIKIALSAIIAAIIIYVGIIFLKGVSFSKSSNRYYVEMNDVNGLAEAAPVLANGVQIGIVNSVRFVTEKQNVLLEIELNEGVRIPNGSKATLAKEMLGAAKLKIILGSKSSGYMAINDTIFGTTGGDLLSAAGDMVPDIEAILSKMDTLLYNVNLIASNPAINNSLYNVQALTQNLEHTSRTLPHLMNNVNGVVGNLGTVSTDVSQLSSDLSSSLGKSGDLMSDARNVMGNLRNATNSVNNICTDMSEKMPRLMNSATTIGENLAQTTSTLNQADLGSLISNLNETIQNLNHITSTLDTMLANDQSTVGKMMNDPSVYYKIDSMLTNASLLLEDLRNHPKRYVHFSLFGKKDK